MAAKTIKASFPGHILTRPTAWRAPYIFASPHSGREYPDRFLTDSILTLADLRRSEDAYVDLLMPDGEALGVPTLAARFPRAFIDVNRSAREIDTDMFTSSPVQGSEIRSSRVLAGFGAIPRYAAEGRDIYGKKLAASDGRDRIKWCYEPYHTTLRQLIEQCLTLFGIAIVVDWHSMPSSAAGLSRVLPDIVLGDRYGVSCERSVIDGWQNAFGRESLSSARNAPYAGGHVTALYGQPATSVNVIQVEINRALYLDEAKVTCLPDKFLALKQQLDRAAYAVVGITGNAFGLAAE